MSLSIMSCVLAHYALALWTPTALKPSWWHKSRMLPRIFRSALFFPNSVVLGRSDFSLATSARHFAVRWGERESSLATSARHFANEIPRAIFRKGQSVREIEGFRVITQGTVSKALVSLVMVA